MKQQADILILNDLKVTVEFTVHSADREVGIMSAYADDYEIVQVRCEPCRNPQYFHDHISRCKGEDERIIELCSANIDYHYGQEGYDY